MVVAASNKTLDSRSAHADPALFTTALCRERWAALDASQWCEPAPGITAQDTLFISHVSDEVVRESERQGAQPSFEKLATLTAGNKPGYLQTPTVFPSVHHVVDLDNDLDLD
jgi:hypothetical protein